MTDLICIDAAFPAPVLEFYTKHGVTIPQKDKIYTARSIRSNSVDGQTGILLHEIQNPLVPINHPVLGVQQIEPSWNAKRFTSLLGQPLKKEDMKVTKDVEQD